MPKERLVTAAENVMQAVVTGSKSDINDAHLEIKQAIQDLKVMERIAEVDAEHKNCCFGSVVMMVM